MIGMKLRTVAFLLVVFSVGVGAGYLSHTVAMAKDGADKPMYSIDNCVSEFSEKRAQKTDQGWRFWFVPSSLSKTLTFKMTEVSAKSANHPPHVHGGEEIIFIFEGTAEFTMKDKTKTVGPNSSMYCPPGVLHGIRNVGDTPLRYAIIKANCPPCNGT